ncbi:hypothetical protein A4X13_0g8351 [Tilletia indica]|uniref:Uncharacterized protein n=1 Tax=Tilletia indica TaxID=43049 RepID=A0A8T8SFL6_9BASI|nr:hypothetical protein A4X13_0g8351 [Tilletia indica]
MPSSDSEHSQQHWGYRPQAIYAPIAEHPVIPTSTLPNPSLALPSSSWVRSTVAHQVHVFGLRKATSIRFLLGVGSIDFCTIIHHVLFTAYGSLLRRIGPSTPVGSSRPADMQFAAQLPPPPPNL